MYKRTSVNSFIGPISASRRGPRMKKINAKINTCNIDEVILEIALMASEASRFSWWRYWACLMNFFPCGRLSSKYRVDTWKNLKHSCRNFVEASVGNSTESDRNILARVPISIAFSGLQTEELIGSIAKMSSAGLHHPSIGTFSSQTSSWLTVSCRP